MPDQNDAFYREHIEALLTRLTECGWISDFGFHKSGSYALKWTEKGRERSEWVRLIASELDLGPKGMHALLTVCTLHAPGGEAQP